jgi:hypothetical protein
MTINISILLSRHKLQLVNGSYIHGVNTGLHISDKYEFCSSVRTNTLEGNYSVYEVKFISRKAEWQLPILTILIADKGIINFNNFISDLVEVMSMDDEE